MKEIEPLAKGSFYWYAPSALTLVTNPAHPLFDVRATEPPDPGLAASLAEFGNHESIKIQRVKRYTDEHGVHHDGAILVANGRRRVIAAKYLEKSTARGGVAPRLKCEHVKGEGDDAPVATMVISNAHRRPENPAELARKARRLESMGRTPREIATMFGVDHGTVKNWLTLANGPTVVLDAVASGAASASVGYALASASPEEATAILAGAKGTKLKGSTARARAKAPEDPDVARRLGVRAIHAMIETFTPAEGETPDATCDVVLATLAFIVGTDPSARGLAAFPGPAAKLARKIRAQ